MALLFEPFRLDFHNIIFLRLKALHDLARSNAPGIELRVPYQPVGLRQLEYLKKDLQGFENLAGRAQIDTKKMARICNPCREICTAKGITENVNCLRL